MNLKRLRNITENPQVGLLVDVYSDDWSQLAWVMAQGTAIIWEHGDIYPEVLAAFRQKYHPYQAMALETRPLIEITPERVLSWGKVK